ncbi:MAG: hypothetical protein HYT80_07195 [Euryarchaeota archaeon]|nr:hypothetical protein [Euryarchaeota archaeon]
MVARTRKADPKDVTGAGLLRIALRRDALPLDLPDPGAVEAYAQGLFDTLQLTYRVPRWDRRTYAKHVLRGAVSAWRPGARVTGSPDMVRVTMPGCPLTSNGPVDPLVCEFCQHVQLALAKKALGRTMVGAKFEALTSLGAPACVLRFDLRRSETPRPHV